MSEQTIKERVIDIIADKSSFEVKDVTPEKNLRDDLEFDSLDHVELAMEFEKAFNVSFPDEAIEKIVTVQDAIDYVEKLGGK